MLPHRRDPYLWIHIAGLATVPLWLDVCLAGLAVGAPWAPPWLELITLVAVGTVPIVWMQWRRPFYIFSVPGLALRPDQLSLERRRLLTIQRGWLSRLLVVLTAIALLWALYTLYQLAPLAADLPWLAGQSRTTGWGISAIAFLLANLFALVPATVVPLLLTAPTRLDQVPPFETAQILTNFTVVGLRLGKILPEPAAIAPSMPATAAVEEPPVGSATDIAPSQTVSAPAAPPIDQPGTPTVANTAATSEDLGSKEGDALAVEDEQPIEAGEAPAAIAPQADDPIEQVAPDAAASQAAVLSDADAAAAERVTSLAEIAAQSADAAHETSSAPDISASHNGAGSLNAPSIDET